MKRSVLITMIGVLAFVLTGILSSSLGNAGEKLVIAIQSEPDTFDLSSTKITPVTELVAANISEKIVGITQSGKLIPGLAASWKMSPDGKEIEFTLRKGVKFHSGDPLTSKDVEFSYKRGVEKISALRRDLALVERLEIIDNYRIKFHFKQPDAAFLPLLGVFYIVSKDYYERVGEEQFIKKPVGTGPYKFVNWVLGQYVDLEANDNYWGEAPSVKKVRFDIVPDESTRVARLQTGEANMVVEIPFSMIKELEKAGFKKVTSPAHPSISVRFHNLNPNVPWYNKKVRLGFALAIDGKSIIEKLFMGIPNLYPGLAPWEVGFDPDLKLYPYDPKKAKELLAEAGYPKGFESPLYYQMGRAAGVNQAAEAVAGYLNAIGIKCKLMGIEPLQFVEKVRHSWHNNPKAEYVAVTGSTICQYPDPSIGFNMFFWSQSPISTYSNPEFDELSRRIRNTLDDTKRGELIKKAIRILYDDVAIIPITAHKMVYMMSKNIDFIPTVKTQYPQILVKDVKIKN
jgi:peptide/nickel transport system substrate-binding protein